MEVNDLDIANIEISIGTVKYLYVGKNQVIQVKANMKDGMK